MKLMLLLLLLLMDVWVKHDGMFYPPIVYTELSWRCLVPTADTSTRILHRRMKKIKSNKTNFAFSPVANFKHA